MLQGCVPVCTRVHVHVHCGLRSTALSSHPGMARLKAWHMPSPTAKGSAPVWLQYPSHLTTVLPPPRAICGADTPTHEAALARTQHSLTIARKARHTGPVPRKRPEQRGQRPVSAVEDVRGRPLAARNLPRKLPSHTHTGPALLLHHLIHPRPEQPSSQCPEPLHPHPTESWPHPLS